MKTFGTAAALLLSTALIVFASAPAASAKGCLKGAAVGGAAGHFAGHHGVLGAAAGCAIGRHEANKKDRQQQKQTTGSGSNR